MEIFLAFKEETKEDLAMEIPEVVIESGAKEVRKIIQAETIVPKIPTRSYLNP